MAEGLLRDHSSSSPELSTSRMQMPGTPLEAPAEEQSPVAMSERVAFAVGRSLRKQRACRTAARDLWGIAAAEGHREQVMRFYYRIDSVISEPATA